MEQDNFYFTLQQALIGAIDKLEQLKGAELEENRELFFVPTDDEKLTFHSGDLVILGARPNINKSYLLLQHINHSIKNNYSAAYFTCGDKELIDIGNSLISINSGISMEELKSSNVRLEMVKKWMDNIEELFKYHMFVIGEPNISFENLEKYAEELKSKEYIDFIVIDSFEYLKEVTSCTKEEYADVVNELCVKLKFLAQRLDVPVIVLMEMPADNIYSKPTVSEFRNNMIIPRMADMILFAHKSYSEGEIEERIEKNAFGPCGRIG